MIGCHCHGVEHILSSRVSVLEQILCLALFSISLKKKNISYFLMFLAVVLGTQQRKR